MWGAWVQAYKEEKERKKREEVLLVAEVKTQKEAEAKEKKGKEDKRRATEKKNIRAFKKKQAEFDLEKARKDRDSKEKEAAKVRSLFRCSSCRARSIGLYGNEMKHASAYLGYEGGSEFEA